MTNLRGTVPIPREQIKVIKWALRHQYGDDLAHGRRRGATTYGKVVRMLSDPTAGLRVQMVPGTWPLVRIQNLLILLTRTSIWAALAIWLLTNWKWAAAYYLFWFTVISPSQRALNLELAARLIALDQRLNAHADEAA
jgi:hypothetical protein